MVRRLTGELSPPVLQGSDLLPGQEWLGRWMQEHHGLQVRVTADAPVPSPEEAITLLLFHAVRELLLNTVKHAQVDTAEVTVTQQDGHVAIEVRDAGVGFAPTALETRGTGFGLFSLQERLRFLGGRVDIVSAPGQGTRISLAAPLRSARSAPLRPAASPLPPAGLPAPAPRGDRGRVP